MIEYAAVALPCHVLMPSTVIRPTLLSAGAPPRPAMPPRPAASPSPPVPAAAVPPSPALPPAACLRPPLAAPEPLSISPTGPQPNKIIKDNEGAAKRRTHMRTVIAVCKYGFLCALAQFDCQNRQCERFSNLFRAAHDNARLFSRSFRLGRHTPGWRARRARRSGPVSHAYHHSKPRPHVVDRADLVVHQARGEAEAPHVGFGHVRH